MTDNTIHFHKYCDSLPCCILHKQASELIYKMGNFALQIVLSSNFVGVFAPIPSWHNSFSLLDAEMCK